MRHFPDLPGAAAILAAHLSMLPFAAAAQQSAPAPDCRRAKTAVEKAICTTPELGAADAAMATAYSQLRAVLPSNQQSLLLADQRRWIRVRDALCSDRNARELADCLLAQTERRQRFLTGEGPSHAPDAPHLQPAFFHEARKGRYEVNVVYPRIEPPRSAGETAFNKAAYGLVAGKDALQETRASEHVPGAPGPSSYDATYDVTYLAPKLAAVVFTISTYGAGAAHPYTGRDSFVFDLSRGRRLTLADILTSPARAVPAIAERCKAQLQAQAAKADWELFDDADFAATVREMRYWAPDKTGVDILFDPYSVAAYAFGAHECRLSWADLSPSLKPDGPLPPR